MFLFKEGIIDMWAEGQGKPYYLYMLIDPRTDEMCYIGLTKQKFITRLQQHRNPKKTNKARIAKLQRHLKRNGMTLQGKVLAKGSKGFIGLLEKWCITGNWRYIGKESIANHQTGGFNAFGKDKESEFKRKATIEKKKKSGEYKTRKGEDIGTAKITKETVLKIYELIKDFKSNQEIIDELSLPIGVTGVCAIRNGSNWKHLFEQEDMVNIPSLKSQNGKVTAKEKFKLLEDIENNLTIDKLKLKYQMTKTDINRIMNKKLWKPVWKLYEEFYKPLNNKK